MIIKEDNLITKNPLLETNEEFTSNIKSSNYPSDDSITAIGHNNNIKIETKKSTTQNKCSTLDDSNFEVNCLALTVRKNYHLSIYINAIKKCYRMSKKIIFSTLVLNIMKLFL